MNEKEYMKKKFKYEEKLKDLNEQEMNGEITYYEYREQCDKYSRKLNNLHDNYLNSRSFYESSTNIGEYLKYKLIKDFEHMYCQTHPQSSYYKGVYDGVMSYILDLYEKLYGLDVNDFIIKFKTKREWVDFYGKYWDTFGTPDEELEVLNGKWTKEAMDICLFCKHFDKDKNWICYKTGEETTPRLTCEDYVKKIKQ